MAGKIKSMIDSIIEQRAKGNEVIALTTKTKMILKGIKPDNYSTTSEDDMAIIARLKEIAVEFGVNV